MLPTGFCTFHFVSFLYVFLFSFLFLLFRFFSHYFVFVFLRFVLFRFFSFLFSLFSFRFFSFRFFSFLFVFFSVSQFTGTQMFAVSHVFKYNLSMDKKVKKKNFFRLDFGPIPSKASFLVHLSRRLKCTIVIMRCPSSVVRRRYLFTFSTSPLKPLNGIHRNLTGSKISTSSTKFVFFGRSEKQDGCPGLWLAETFSTSLKPLNRIQRNLTGSKITTSLPSLCFPGRSR